MKIVTKVIVNHLKSLMSKLKYETQISFIPSRQALDNIVLAH